MEDCQGNPLRVGDKVRFFGSGGGTVAYETDPIKQMRAHGTIVKINGNVADIQVRGSPRVWHRYGIDILKRG